MITIQGKADCVRCRNNPAVYQPSTEKETEWICCDKYKVVPTLVVTGKGKCKYFEKAETKIITEQRG